MKLLIISDSHGNIANLKHVMGFAKKLKIDTVIHCGDWNTIKSVDTVLSFEIPLYTVLGNADIDPAVSEKLKVNSKKFSESFLELQPGERKIGITHKPSDVKKFFAGSKLDIIFTGHYHSKDDRVVNGVRIVRSGAIINGNNFAIYNTETNEVEFINE